jgi:hypothetical protein
MGFDPITWLITFGLNTAGKEMFENIYKGLPLALSGAVKSWEAALPDTLHFNIEALFSHVITGENIEAFPARKKLGESFEQRLIPSQNIWLNALVERWCQVRTIEIETEDRPFFLQKQEDAEIHLQQLSKRLESICTDNKDLFQSTTISELYDISKTVRHIDNSLEDIKKSVQAPVIGINVRPDAEIDALNGLDNQLISELSVAGYVNEADGVQRAVYLDKDHLYVHRSAIEKQVTDSVSEFISNPQANSNWLSIIGDAGQGKSSLLWYLFDQFKQYGYEVYCILAQLSGAQAISRLNEALPFLKENSIIIIDTLDLLVGIDNAKLATSINSIRKAGHYLITTCRRQEIRGIASRCDIEIELNRYTDDEAVQAIHNYVKAFYQDLTEHEWKIQFENIWNILDSQRIIQELDLDPLILSMIFQTYIPDKIPQDINTQQVYDKYWQDRVLNDRNPRDVEKRNRINLCHHLARCIVFAAEGADSFSIDELATEWNKRRGGAFPSETLDKLVSSGIFHLACGMTHVRFFHQTFLEYTAAIDIRFAKKAEHQSLLDELYNELKNNDFRRSPILKQIAIQDHTDNHNGLLYQNIFVELEIIHSLLSLQIALEILGKIGNDVGNVQQICFAWISENPSNVATTARETVKHYSKAKVPTALNLLEPCLQTHEEIAIYNICGNKLVLMDPEAVYEFLRKRVKLLSVQQKGENLLERKTRIRDAMLKVFACSGFNKALWDLYDFYLTLTVGQQAGFLTNLALSITEENCHEIGLFCEKIVEPLIDSDKGEIRLSFIALLEKLVMFDEEQVETISQKIYDSNRWEDEPEAAQFTGALVGKFLLDQEKVKFLISNIDTSNPMLRLLCTWALQEANSQLHDEIIYELIKLTHPGLNENTRQMLFKVASRLNNISYENMNQFLNECPWPSNVVYPVEFKQIFLLLADKNEQLTKNYLWTEFEKASGHRRYQIFVGLMALISKNIGLFTKIELRQLYGFASSNDVIKTKFCNIAGLLVYNDNKFANDIYCELLKDQKQDVKTAALKSLSFSINDNLEFTLSLGESIFRLSGKSDGYSLLHCYLDVLQTYKGQDVIRLLNKLDAWFDENYLLSLYDETAVVKLLILLKIHAKGHPVVVLNIAKRCQVFSQGVAGALSAVYSNVVTSLDDADKLSQILLEFFKFVNFQEGGHKNIRNAVKNALPKIAQKIGCHKVFELFFEKYKEIKSPHALEDLAKTVISIPGWSDTEKIRLINDSDLPPQVKSIVISNAANGL